MHLFFSHKSNGSQCTLSHSTSIHFIEKIWPWIDGIISSYLPAFLIGGFNFLIIYKLKQNNRIKPNVTITSTSTSKASSQITFILLCISTFFISTTVPITAYIIMFRAFHFEFSQEIYDILNLTFYLNFCCNILFYCYSGSLFQKELKQLFCQHQSAREQGTTA